MLDLEETIFTRAGPASVPHPISPPTCGHVESSRIDQQLALLLSVDLGQLGKSDIVTNPQANLTPGGGEGGELVTRAQGVRLLERHLTGDI